MLVLRCMPSSVKAGNIRFVTAFRSNCVIAKDKGWCRLEVIRLDTQIGSEFHSSPLCFITPHSTLLSASPGLL